ncbi:MAG TPA: cell division/cell wall cluster transcriptional repressor MraZ [Elusimicrobia bacterium]|nr:cell division/cell wall cluster transcriptional repressor MraZ [Elusimicrobiota bacterium]
MTAIIGQYEYTLDPKNRVVVPPSYRNALIGEKGAHFILAIGQDGCLRLFLPSQWDRLVSEARTLTQEVQDKEKARAARRYLFASAVEAPLDEQGRILVPSNLKEIAALKKDVVIVGAGTWMELWAQERWTKYHKSAAAPAFTDLSKDLDI